MQSTVPELCRSLQDARGRTLALVGDLEDAQFEVPELEHVNPFLWELGHVAFFFDVFVLGVLDGSQPLIERAHERFESFSVDHALRWKLDFPGRVGILEYMARVEERVLARLRAERLTQQSRYLHTLSLLHEDMHGEAFTYMRQSLGYRAPGSYRSLDSMPRGQQADSILGDVRVPGGRYRLGSEAGRRFSFDNERAAHEVEIAPFSIARSAVTQAEFQRFVQAGAYVERGLWSEAGWAWKCAQEVHCPAYWTPDGSGWQVIRFGELQPLEPELPMQHVSYWEAEAFCRWAGRRLPTEAEWELAATGSDSGKKRLYPWGDAEPSGQLAQLDARRIGCAEVGAFAAGDSEWGCRQMLGNVWEWTSSDFRPYPGFVIDTPYREYSAPWFRGHKVLRGGSWATRSRLIHCAYRNFFPPARRDIFSGLRTCAL